MIPEAVNDDAGTFDKPEEGCVDRANGIGICIGIAFGVGRGTRFESGLGVVMRRGLEVGMHGDRGRVLHGEEGRGSLEARLELESKLAAVIDPLLLLCFLVLFLFFVLLLLLIPTLVGNRDRPEAAPAGERGMDSGIDTRLSGLGRRLTLDPRSEEGGGGKGVRGGGSDQHCFDYWGVTSSRVQVSRWERRT